GQGGRLKAAGEHLKVAGVEAVVGPDHRAEHPEGSELQGPPLLRGPPVPLGHHAVPARGRAATPGGGPVVPRTTRCGASTTSRGLARPRSSRSTAAALARSAWRPAARFGGGRCD